MGRPLSDGSARVGRIKLSISDIADGFGNARVDKSKKEAMDD